MKHSPRLRNVAALGYVTSILIFCATATIAADYPERPIRLMVPGAAGWGMDVIGRLVANRMSESLKQSVVVENRPGAAGNHCVCRISPSVLGADDAGRFVASHVAGGEPNSSNVTR